MCIQKIFFAAFVALTVLTANLAAANTESTSADKKFPVVVIDPISGYIYEYKLQQEDDFVKLSNELVMPGFFVFVDGEEAAEMLKNAERRIEAMRRETGGWMYVFNPADKSDLSKRIIEAIEKIMDIDQAYIFKTERRYIKKTT